MTAKAKNGGSQAVEQTIAATKQAVENVTKANQDAARMAYDQLLSLSRDYGGAAQRFYAGVDDVVELGRANIEAVLASGTSLVKGLEDISKVMFGLVESSSERGVEAAKAMISAKTMNEVVDLQANYARSSVEQFFADSNRISELGAKVANEIAAPLSERFTVAVERLRKPLAA